MRHKSVIGLFGLAQIFGLVILILFGVWFGNVRGAKFSWSSAVVFNNHPLFMILGLLICYGESIMFYRVFTGISKYYVKIAHALVHILALIFALIGFAAIIMSKNYQGKKHFETSHSWTGLICIVLFIFQWIFGFVAYLYPKLSENIRRCLMPIHRIMGSFIFILSVIAIISGINYINTTPATALYGNFLTLFVILFVLVIALMILNPSYQRPNEDGNNQSMDQTVEMIQSK